MSTFILAFGFFLTMVLAMAVGYLFQKKSIDRKKSRMEKEEARQKKLNEWKQNQIL